MATTAVARATHAMDVDGMGTSPVSCATAVRIPANPPIHPGIMPSIYKINTRGSFAHNRSGRQKTSVFGTAVVMGKIKIMPRSRLLELAAMDPPHVHAYLAAKLY